MKPTTEFILRLLINLDFAIKEYFFFLFFWRCILVEDRCVLYVVLTVRHYLVGSVLLMTAQYCCVL